MRRTASLMPHQHTNPPTNPPTMSILTDEMLQAAFDFRAAEPWKALTDSDVFALQLTSGDIAYIVVMGNASEHYALGLYVGALEFRSYLLSLVMNDMETDDIQEAAMTFNCVNCDFMAAADMKKADKERIRAFATAHSLKIPRQHGWPDFTRHTPYHMQWGITDERDARNITEALRAAIYMGRLVAGKTPESIGLDPTGSYPDLAGGKQVPLLVPQADGSYTVDTTPLPPFTEPEYPHVAFDNDILSSRVAGLPSEGGLACQLTNVPAPFPDEDEVPSFPAMLFCVTERSGIVMPFFVDDEEPESSILTQLANQFISIGLRPRHITISTPRTEALLRDFCKRCGIKLVVKKEMPKKWKEAHMLLMMQMGGL